MLRPEEILDAGLPAADEVPPRFLRRGGDADGRELPAPVVVDQLHRVPAVGLDPGLRQQKGSRGGVSKTAMARGGGWEEGGRELFRSWATSGFLDHAKANVTCAGCHGRGIPDQVATVDDGRCLACHGGLEARADRVTVESGPVYRQTILGAVAILHGIALMS